MAEIQESHLRIYCICGQKMKVSEEMLGRPAKCVACRQKIRIPRADEIPPGTAEIHLKDHPEFLRTAGRSAPAAEGEWGVVALGAEPGDAEAVALDVLEPLKLLCSLEYDMAREDGGPSAEVVAPGDEPDAEKAAILAKVRDARADLDRALRRRLTEFAAELEGVKEELVQLALAVRTGDRDFLTSRDRVLELRGRRDRLERRRQNLRGWLVCDDPYLAGGYNSHASPERIPEAGFQVTFPPEPERLRSLVDEHVETLRNALYRREQAERKLRETELLVAEGKTGWRALAPNLAACVADKKRADAAVAFARDRLERLGRDYASDIQAIEAQIDRARERLAVKGLDRARFDALRHDLRSARADIARDNRLVARALRATRAQDVPHGRGAGGLGMFSDVGVDPWIAWGAALLLVICLFVPMLDGVSPLMALRAAPPSPLRSLAFILMVSAASFSAAAFVPHRGARGALLCGLWLASCLVGTLWVHEVAYGSGPLGQTLRRGGIWMWMLRPGMVLVVLAELGVLAAAWVALAPLKRALWVCFSVVLVAASVLAAAIFTDFGGYRLPKLYVMQESRYGRQGAELTYETRITVGNTGGRAFRLAVETPATPKACQYSLERQLGTGVWASVGEPEEVRVDGAVILDTWREVFVHAKAVLIYQLPPGYYRARLLPYWAPENPVVEVFALAAAPASPDAGVPAESTVSDADSEPEMVASPDFPHISEHARYGTPPSDVVVELRGLATAEGRDPRFAFTVTLPDGTSRQRDLELKSLLHDDWTLEEYNRENQTVTLTRGNQLVILHRGEPTALPAPTKRHLPDDSPASQDNSFQ